MDAYSLPSGKMMNNDSFILRSDETTCNKHADENQDTRFW